MSQAEGYRPAEAAGELGVPSSTLRLYSVRFAPLLSDAAARPVERAGGRPGFRLYNERDLAVLREGKRLLESGLTYQEALKELRRHWQPRQIGRGLSLVGEQRPATEQAADGSSSTETTSDVSRETPPPASSETTPRRREREDEWDVLVKHLVGSLNSSQALATEWRRIVEERNEEVRALREEMNALRVRLRRAEEEASRPWWQRLFGG
ncbi:MAG: MerR family transcriptional regulator [Chloroflexota bacterium]